MHLITTLLFISLNINNVINKNIRTNSDGILVKTSSGLVRGVESTFDELDYLEFKGIPYAEAPVGDLRFKPPNPKEFWSDIFDANNFGYSCMQSRLLDDGSISEDCLNLNIFVPVTNSTKLPVLFYIHGGEFVFGSVHIYGPQYYLKQGVVVVTANYRLGSFGFLSLDIPEATGNNGIKDIILALEWINTNIEKFGGDPNAITVGGLSAGSVIVNYLLIIEKTEKLFQRAILDSGAALGYRMNLNPVESARKLGEILCGDIYDEQSILHCLLNQTSTDIVKAQGLVKDTTRQAFTTSTPFLPVIEIESYHRVIKEKPIVSFRNGLKQNVPVLVGHNCKEGLKMNFIVNFNFGAIELLNEDPRRYIPLDMDKLNATEEFAVSSKIQEFYFDGGNITMDNIDDYFNLITDTHYLHPIYSWLRYHKSHSDSNDVFYYNFCFDGKLNIVKRVMNAKDYDGASHADQLGYLFWNKFLNVNNIDDDEPTKEVQSQMITMWSNFVKFGNPTPEESQIIWKKSQYPAMNHLLIADTIVNIDHRPFAERIDFWDSLYNYYYSKYGY